MFTKLKEALTTATILHVPSSENLLNSCVTYQIMQSR